MIKQNKKNYCQLIKYVLVTVVSYIFLFVGTYLLVEFYNINPGLVYFILITIIYLGVYVSYTKYVFEDTFNHKTASRFMVASIIIWLMNNAFFGLLFYVIKINYLIVITLNLIVLGLIRFSIQKFFVFKKDACKHNKKFALTFDLELWHEGDWIKKNLIGQELPDGLAENTRKILGLLEKYRQKATFFTTLEILEKYPEEIKKIFLAGHEISIHGPKHLRLTEYQPEEFTSDIKKSIILTKEITGKPPLGYRAPHFSLSPKTSWILPILKKHELKYDSSIFPVSMWEYGNSHIPLKPYKIYGELTEYPVVVWEFGPLRVPVAGGIYFRILPFRFFITILKLAGEKTTPILYFHPHELDPNTPRVKRPWWKAKLKYWGQAKVDKKFEALLNHFEFDSIGNLFKI